MQNFIYAIFLFTTIQLGFAQTKFPNLENSKNSLNYSGYPASATDRTSLAFSDKGSWFAYGFLNANKTEAGFSGPLLLTEQNGVWLSPAFTSFHLKENRGQNEIDWKVSLVRQTSYNSHLEQEFKTKNLIIRQQLFFLSGHTALQKTSITNISNESIKLNGYFSGEKYLKTIQLHAKKKEITVTSKKGNAVGHLQFFGTEVNSKVTSTGYTTTLHSFVLKPKQTKEILIAQTFIFPQYSWKEEQQKIRKSNFDLALETTKQEKELQLTHLISHKKPIYADSLYSNLLAKLALTLQNNTRIAAEGLKHNGLFPSYHYEWFNGFWAWDSWKQAAAVVHYDPELAKNQIRAMFDYQEPNGFIPDCVYRDTLIEPNNYRNTKSPLAAWAVLKVYKKTNDKDFLKALYPKLKKYHEWWFRERDHDHDGLCEFGSTDGTLIAAKWESGMDNAVRFDSSVLLQNRKYAFSLDQESVDLNSFLYAEKIFLSEIASVLEDQVNESTFKNQSEILKGKIQAQFWDETTGWFYDSTIDGKTLLKDMGCEGYFPLWANAATPEQAEKIKNNMMNPEIFNTFIPLPTLAANHPKFKPEGGYWRGPIWLDQVYFGITGLNNYGYQKEAETLTYKTIHNAEGVLKKGHAIRENYQPITGKGLEAYNFSWSAAHFMMLLLND